MDEGTASLYKLFYSYTAKNETEPRTFEIKNDELLKGSLVSPLPASKKVRLFLPEDYFVQEYTIYTMYVFAIDDVGNVGEKSNIAWICNVCRG